MSAKKTIAEIKSLHKKLLKALKKKNPDFISVAGIMAEEKKIIKKLGNKIAGKAAKKAKATKSSSKKSVKAIAKNPGAGIANN